MRLTSGICSATCWSKRTSRLVTIASAVRIMITPRVRCNSGPRPARRTRSNSAPTAERQPQQHDSGSERVGDRDHDRAPAGGADRDHGREDRAGAGRVDEPERGADEQPRAEAVSASSSDRARPVVKAGPPAGRRSPAPAARRRRRAARRRATSRSGSEPSPTPPTTFAIPTIVTVNVTISPSTIPSGRRRPPTPPEASSAGSTGSTHGDSAVPAPARMAKRIRINMGEGAARKKLVRLS